MLVSNVNCKLSKDIADLDLELGLLSEDYRISIDSMFITTLIWQHL